MTIQLESSPLPWLIPTPAMTPARAAEEHLDITEAIAAGDPDRARAAAERRTCRTH